jgi:prepilin-type processing-associated H-X9-DG protein
MFPMHTVYGYIPPGQNTITPGNQRNGTWILSLLPQLDQQVVFNQVNFSLPIYGQMSTNGMQQIGGLKITTLHCPSDAVVGAPMQGLENTNYRGASSIHWNDQGWARDPWAGVFADWQCTRIADIQDGTSQTIMIGETSTYGWVGGPAVGWGCGGGRQRGQNDGVTCAAMVNPAVNYTLGPGNVTQPIHPDGQTGYTPWWNNIYQDGPGYCAYWGINTDWPGCSSVHTGGAQFCMADGSVRFINQTINSGWVAPGGGMSVWISLNTRNSSGATPWWGGYTENTSGDY